MPITDKNGQVLSTRQVLHKGKTRLKTILLELWTGFLWWGVGFLPFHSLRRFFYRLSGMKIGPQSTIHMMARIYQPAGISIGQVAPCQIVAGVPAKVIGQRPTTATNYRLGRPRLFQ